MKSQLRHLIAEALYPTKSYNLPSVCERYGLATGSSDEAFSSKTRYVMSRLEGLSDEKVFEIAKAVIQEFPDDKLVAAVEKLRADGHLVSDISRRHLMPAFNGIPLAGSLSLIEFLREHCPELDQASSYYAFQSRADDIVRHAVRNDDWSNSEILEYLGFLVWSQTRLFSFIESCVHPIRRTEAEQLTLVENINPILRRDGFNLVKSAAISGYPTYTVAETTRSGTSPADQLISKSLISFDEAGVHQAWEKALERRGSDPEGAVTAAKTLLETVCKHIIDDAGGSYGDNDDLPKLYHTAAEHLNLAPSQHTEPLFKTILGNCHSVVGTLAGLCNKLGDAHGQGKKQVRLLPRHAELAVNLAGSVATFLVSTWNARKPPDASK